MTPPQAGLKETHFFFQQDCFLAWLVYATMNCIQSGSLLFSTHSNLKGSMRRILMKIKKPLEKCEPSQGFLNKQSVILKRLLDQAPELVLVFRDAGYDKIHFVNPYVHQYVISAIFSFEAMGSALFAYSGKKSSEPVLM